MAHYLIFTLHGSFYGVDSLIVREVVRLPLLTVIDELPGFFPGAFDLRGTLVPVLDLNIRFGRKPARYSPAQGVVVLESEGVSFGIIADEVVEVASIDPSCVKTHPERLSAGSHHFISGEATKDGGIIMLLDVSGLMHEAPGVPEAAAESGLFCPGAAGDELEAFRERARALAGRPAFEAPEARAPVVAFSVRGEYVGIEARFVSELSWIKEATPVPGTPAHVMGAMNLRGDVVVVVDIGPAIGLKGQPSNAMAVVVDLDGVRAAVPVDEIFGIVDVSEQELSGQARLKPAPAECVKCVVPFMGRALSVIDPARAVLGGLNG